MHWETKYLRLFRAVELGDDTDGWRVRWLGGWDKCAKLGRILRPCVDSTAAPEPQLRHIIAHV
jgi:hypothetical protein